MPPGNPFVRRDIWSMEPDDPIVLAYGDAVAAMKGKRADDPTSWAYQAAIHGTGAPAPPALANECRHQSWYFAPWHRMYLYWFERIVRAEVLAAGGPDTWALPFWDYDRNGTRRLPRPFRDANRPDGSPNPLFVANRNPGVNSGTAGLPASVTSAVSALSRPNYTGTAEFGGGAASAAGQFKGRTGRLEATPHNDIHVQIGGLMGDPDTAALDPIFWLHHADIDRLWFVWDDSTHQNPTAGEWSRERFEFFDENGAKVRLRCRDVVDIVTQLDYTYEGGLRFANLGLTGDRLTQFRQRPQWPSWIKEVPKLPISPEPGPGPEIVGASDHTVRLVGHAESVRVPIDAPARRAVLGDAAPKQVVLEIENIDAERNPGVVYGVYVNLPDDPSAEDLAAHHVGNVALFGIERVRNPRRDDHPHGGMQVAIDITDLVAQLTEGGERNDAELDVTFRPIGLDVDDDSPESDSVRAAVAGSQQHEDVPISVGRVSLHVR